MLLTSWFRIISCKQSHYKQPPFTLGYIREIMLKKNLYYIHQFLYIYYFFIFWFSFFFRMKQRVRFVFKKVLCYSWKLNGTIFMPFVIYFLLAATHTVEFVYCNKKVMSCCVVKCSFFYLFDFLLHFSFTVYTFHLQFTKWKGHDNSIPPVISMDKQSRDVTVWIKSGNVSSQANANCGCHHYSDYRSILMARSFRQCDPIYYYYMYNINFTRGDAAPNIFLYGFPSDSISFCYNYWTILLKS